MSDGEPFYCPICSVETPRVWSMEAFTQTPRNYGPRDERAGGSAEAHRCPRCGYVEINSDDLFTPPSDAFKPPRDDEDGFDRPGETE